MLVFIVNVAIVKLGLEKDHLLVGKISTDTLKEYFISGERAREKYKSNKD